MLKLKQRTAFSVSSRKWIHNFKISKKNKDEENKKKLDMFRKARADAEDSGKNPESV